MLPGAVDAKPHCGLSARYSMATYCAASSIGAGADPVFPAAGLLSNQPEDNRLPPGHKAQRLEATGALGVVFQQKTVDVKQVEGFLGDCLVAPLGDPGTTIIPRHMESHGYARFLAPCREALSAAMTSSSSYPGRHQCASSAAGNGDPLNG